jgi:aminodeoxyfutalosine synthase
MSLQDIETIVAAGEPLGRAHARRLLTSTDLPAIGMLAEAARVARTGDVVTFGRVAVWEHGAPQPSSSGEAGELRLGGRCRSFGEARAQVRAAVSLAGQTPVTGFAPVDLLMFADDDLAGVKEVAAALAAEGLSAIAEVPVDNFDATEDLIAFVDAVRSGGLGAWRFTVHRAAVGARLDLIERVAALQRASGDVRAFAPLPRVDPAEEPSTGYDDVRTVAIARMMVLDVPAIQVDWPLYGPKLAQVAITFGAGDIDGVASADDPLLGPRRAARAEIERQIRAAGAIPAERTGRYERRS